MQNNVNPNVLKNVLVSLFPESNIQINARKTGKIVSPTTGSFLELDFVVSDFNLAFEFQDVSHYITTNVHRPVATIQQLDNIKQREMDRRGETLIVVPYWWDGHSDSLVATIRSYRPDLLKDYSKNNKDNKNNNNNNNNPIPLHPPSVQLSNTIASDIPGVGELMLPSFYVHNFNTSSWWMSEKYDGVRVCWNPNDRKLYTKYVREIELSSCVLKLFPSSIFIDGEIWFGRGQYEQIQNNLTNNNNNNELYYCFRFLYFDCPHFIFRNFEFEVRFKSLLDNISIHHPFLIPTQQVKSEENNHLKKFLEKIINNEGEGVVIRKPKSIYENGRSDNVFKFKLQRDSEALVTHVDPPYYSLQLPNKIEFTAKEEKEGERKIREGEIITFSFSHYSPSGVPLGAKISRVRHSFEWGNDAHMLPMISDPSVLDRQDDRKPFGHWANEEGKEEIRKFLIKYAATQGFDPFYPHSWYTVTTTDIRRHGGSGILNPYNGSIVLTLENSFPELTFDKSKFKLHPKFYWHSLENRKQFFEELASENGINSSDINDWYKLTSDILGAKKGGRTMLKHYGSIKAALTSVYPNFKFHSAKFATTSHFHWQSLENRKTFFDEFAKLKNFDPLVPKNWYKWNNKHIEQVKGGKTILSYYRGSLFSGLSQVYPNIGLSVSLFFSMPQKYWHNLDNRKNFFETLAKKKKFDSNKKENWYNINKLDVLLEKGGISILVYYQQSIRRALMELYPNIGLEECKFVFVK